MRNGRLAPCPAVESPSRLLLVRPAPLLEEEWDAFGFTLPLYVENPGSLHRARPGAGLAADDDPVNSFEGDA